MKTFLRIVFVIAFLSISIHTVRLIYMVWLAPTGSVLDQYDETVESRIKAATSLDELVAMYDDAHRAVQEYEADEANPVLENPWNKEPYQSRRLLREAIDKWESQSSTVHKTRAYWAFGFAFFIVGVVAFKWIGQWLGVSALVVAFSEMIYWSSPPYFSGRLHEFERLLNNKLFLAVFAFALLVCAGYLAGLLRDNKALTGNADGA
jgi:Flp pilus assembly protein TadB